MFIWRSSRTVGTTAKTAHKATTAAKHTKPPVTRPTVPPWTTSQVSAALDAQKVLRRIYAATTIGVSESDYHERLIDCTADVTEDLRQVPSGPVGKDISDALQCYIDAAAFWKDDDDAIGSLPDPSKVFVNTKLSKTVDLDTFNNTSEVSSIENKYGLQPVAGDPIALTSSSDRFKRDLAPYAQQLSDSQNPNSEMAKDPGVALAFFRLITDFEKSLYGRTISIEKDALTTYLTSSLTTIWGKANSDEQASEAAMPKSN